MIHGITESFKVPKSNHPPSPTSVVTTDCVPKCHSHAVGALPGMELHQFPAQSVPVISNHSVRKYSLISHPNLPWSTLRPLPSMLGCCISFAYPWLNEGGPSSPWPRLGARSSSRLYPSIHHSWRGWSSPSHTAMFSWLFLVMDSSFRRNFLRESFPSRLELSTLNKDKVGRKTGEKQSSMRMKSAELQAAYAYFS